MTKCIVMVANDFNQVKKLMFNVCKIRCYYYDYYHYYYVNILKDIYVRVYICICTCVRMHIYI